MDNGALYSMEVNNLEQVLLYPYFEEIKPTVHRLATNNKTQSLSKTLPFITIRKNSAE
jgi:hypothetical protein